jgi:hypothetical protein
MQTGFFEFEDEDYDASKISRVERVTFQSGSIADTRDCDFRKWVVADGVFAQFFVTCDGVRFPLRYGIELPEVLVKRCREEIGRLNWMNTIWGDYAKRHAKHNIRVILDCPEVRKAEERAYVKVEQMREEFRRLLNLARLNMNREMVELMQAQRIFSGR